MAESGHSTPRKRRWKRFLIGAPGVLLLLALIYPLWFPWVLKPVAASLGVRYERSQRNGYARIELFDVRLQSGSSSVRAERIDFQMPHRWLWIRWTGTTVTEPQVIVDRWRFASQPAGEPSEPATGSTAGLLDAVQAGVPPLSKWLRWVVLTHGEVQLPATTLTIPSATLRDEQGRVDLFESQLRVDLALLASSSLSLAFSNAQATAEVRLEKEDGEWAFDGGVTWQSNRFEVVGRFDQNDWLPAEARLGSDSITTPPALSGLAEFPELGGSSQALWADGVYTFDVNLTTVPTTGADVFSEPISLQAAGGGDLEALRLTRFQLASPFLKVALGSPLAFEFAGSVDGRGAALNLWADLSQVEEIPAEGQLSGVITVQPASPPVLRAGFSLHGTNIAAAGLNSKSLVVEGRVNWPLVEVTHLGAEFDSGGTFAAELEMDFEQRSLLQSTWNFIGPWPGSLPESVVVEMIHASGTAEGLWPGLTHHGTVEMSGLKAAPFRAASGRVSWSGEQLSLDRVAVRLESGSSTLDLAGQGGVVPGDGFDADVVLDSFDLVTRKSSLRLTQPARLEWDSGTNGFVVELSPLELTGADSRLAMQASIHWPSSGSGQLTLHGLSSADLDDFTTPDLSELSVSDATIGFAWDNGPLMFDVNAKAEWRAEDGAVWSANCEANSDGDLLQFNPVRIDLNGDPALNLDGHLPLRIEPGAGWDIVESPGVRTARLELSVIEQGPLWLLVEEYAGIQLGSPALSFHAHGAVPDIQGCLSFRAGSVGLVQTNTDPVFTHPQLDDLTIEVLAGLRGVEIREASAQLLGQRIEAQANWEVAAANWNEWLDTIRAHDLKRLTGRVRMTNAEFAALSALAPDIIAPLGTLDLDLSVQPGLRVDGHLVLTDAATRYLKPIGALRDIDADLTLEGWNATIHSFSGSLGGQPVNLSGELEWRPDGDRRFDLNLTGENLSLVRDPELFVRADLDLRLQKSFDKVAVLSGEVQLQRSLLFRDFNSLLGFNRDQPEQRPPYFSVPQAPFGDWQLDVRVKGDRFLSVFSPAFKGEVSAGLQLLGTLREPLAVGAVTVDSGKILFPFGTLQVESGRVDLTRDDPYRPRLDFRGQGMNYGYSVTVDLRGRLDAPNLTFQSVPPLSAQQILLMLTAGEVPRSDFGYNSTDKAGRVGLYVGRELVNRFIGNTTTTERLELRSGENITDDGKPTYSIEYRFTDRWSAFGEYDRFQNVNSGLKFKVLSK